MNDFLVNLLVVLVFTLLGGFFAAAEIALVSLRESQVQRLAAERGRKGERLSRLVHDPNRFLAAVQLAVTMAAFLSAGFGASQMSPQVAPLLVDLGLSQGAADTVAFLLVTILLVYISLVLGELTPKRIGLQRAEAISVAVAGLVDWLARITRPFIWLLSVSTDVMVRLLGGDPGANKEVITEEELRGMVATQATLTPQERELIDDVFDAGERELREVMVPRTEVEFLDSTLPAYKAARIVVDLPHSRYPVFRGSQDDVLGFVHIRDILAPDVADRGIRLEDLVREVLFMPGSKRVLPAMFEMRYPGIVMQAVGLTFGTLAALLMAYRSGLIKVTENFKLGVVAATGGIAILYLINIVMGFFGHSMGFIHNSGWIGIGFSAVVVVVASLNLVLDFDFIESGAEQGAPKYMEWYASFGLSLTLVWLYLELLRLLSKLRD